MSGGYFDYQQFAVSELEHSIEQFLKKTDLPEYHQFSEHTLSEFRVALALLRKARIYAHRIDYLLSSDDSEKSFHERLKEDLENESNS